jgi:hypothetical protein
MTGHLKAESEPMVWLQSIVLTPTNYPATLKTIRIHFARFQNQPDPSGAQIRLMAFAGAAGTTAPPINPTLLVDQNVTIPTITNPAFVDFPIQNGPTISSGDFYIGYQAPNPTAGVFLSADINGPQQLRAFSSFDNGVNYQPLVSGAPPTSRNILIHAVFSVFPEAVSVSGASFLRVTLAPEMIVAVFGVNLATGTEIAATIPLPTILRGTTVSVKDSAGIERSAQLFFVSSGQLNYLMPPGTAAGSGTRQDHQRHRTGFVRHGADCVGLTRNLHGYFQWVGPCGSPGAARSRHATNLRADIYV